MAKQMWHPWRAFSTQHPAAADGLARAWARTRPYLPPVNFITVHHAYFLFGGLAFAVVFWALSAGEGRAHVSFIDSLFLVESAFTSAGLNTVNLSALNTAQQALMAVLMLMGSQVVVALFTIWFRAHIFERRFQDIVQGERNRASQTTSALAGMAGAMFATQVMSSFKRRQPGDAPAATAPALHHPAPTRRGTWQNAQRAAADVFKLSPRPNNNNDDDDNNNNNIETPNLGTPLQPVRESKTLQFDDDPSPLTPRPGTSPRPPSAYHRREPSSSAHHRRQNSSIGGGEDLRPTMSAGTATGAGGFDLKTFISENKKSIGRNAQFHDLTDEQREFLGGVEWRALKVLFIIVSVYFVTLQVLGAVALGAWTAVRAPDIAAVSAQNPWWAGIFLAISAFNNAGLTLLDAGIAAFDDDAFVLTVVTLLALAGSYMFPACIRATVFMCNYALRRWTAEHEYKTTKDALEFILKYPRRIFMLMFPWKANLVFIGFCASLAVLNWVSLLVLSIGNAVLDAYPVGQRVGLALFQALAIPSDGYLVLSASGLYFDVQVFWVVMMYLAAYPEIITMRNSNVYEERSLGIYQSSNDSDATLQEKPDDPSSSASSDDDDGKDTLPQPNRAPTTILSPRPMSASGASYAPSTQSIRRIGAIGRRGTAFVGTQIQKRMNNFQGVGVAPRPQQQHTVVPNNNNNNNKPTGGATTVVVAEEGHVDLVTQHLRSQLSHDIWSIALALFLITIIETAHSLGDPQTYSVFNFLFEIVSGYTNIGLSMGVPGQSYSFSGAWYTGSKLIMVLMMVRGRHRGLPVALDHAVKLPGWDNARRQQEDAEIRKSIAKSRRSLDRTMSC